MVVVNIIWSLILLLIMLQNL